MNKFLKVMFALVIIAMTGAAILQIVAPEYMGSNAAYGISTGWQREIGFWNLAVLIILVTTCFHYDWVYLRAILLALILGGIGILKANEAERYGVAASAGRILNWISVAIGGMFLVLFGGGLLLAIMLALSDSAANSSLVETVQILAFF